MADRTGLARLLPYPPPQAVVASAGPSGNGRGAAVVASGRNGHYPSTAAGRRAADLGLVAAGSRVTYEDRPTVAILKRREAWQELCWDAFDTIGEVKYGSNFLGNALSRLRLYVGVRPARFDEDPVPVIIEDGAQDGVAVEPATIGEAEARDVLDALQRIASRASGHGDILRELGQNLTVAGECYLYGRETADGGETWDVRSVDEVVAHGKNPDGEEQVWIVDDPSTKPEDGHRYDEDAGDLLIRIWQQHPRFSRLADSPLRGVLSSCEELLLAEQAVRASFRSRLPAGAFLVPEELSFGAEPDETIDEADGQADEDPLLRDLMDAMVTPTTDESAVSGLVPTIMRGKAEYLKEVRHLTFDRKLDEHIEERTERALRRLAQGLNVPVEVITGMADVNHWTAWQIEDSTFSAHVEPLAIMVVNALTVAYLHPMLEEAGVADPDRFVIWYDPSRLIARTGVEDNAHKAHERMTISDEAHRRHLGFGEDDAPTAEEIAARIDRERAKRFIGSQADEETPARGVPEGDGTGTAPAAPEAVRPASARRALTAAADRIAPSLPRRLVDIDRDLRTRLQTAADDAMRRCLERVGANLRSRARKNRQVSDAIAATDNGRVAAQLGPTMVQSLGVDELDLIDGSFDGLADRFDRWAAAAQEQTLRLVPGLDDAERGALQARQADDRADAWAWFRQALTSLAVDRLYDPDPEPDGGEHDPTTTVPFALVREAVARAGGAAEGVTAAMAAPTIATLGIATGLVAQQAFGDHGVQVEGWQWVYGPFPRDNGFEPHEALDGTTFASFEDDVLRNMASWPPVTHFVPGDHAGCVCDVQPVMLDVESIGQPAPAAPGTVGPTPSEGPNRGRADDLWFADVDDTLAAMVQLRRHPGGGYTADEGRWYIRQAGNSWVVDEQIRGDDGILRAERVGVVPVLQAARTLIARAGGGT